MTLEGIAAILLFLIGILSECGAHLPDVDEEWDFDEFAAEDSVQIVGVRYLWAS